MFVYNVIWNGSSEHIYSLRMNSMYIHAQYKHIYMLSSIFHLLPSTNLDIILQFYIRLWLNENNEKLNVADYRVRWDKLLYLLEVELQNEPPQTPPTRHRP